MPDDGARGRAARTAFGVCRTTVSISVSATKSETRLSQATSEVSAGKAARRASIRSHSAEKSCAGGSSSGSPLLISHGRVFGTGPRRDRLVCWRCGLPSQSANVVSANGNNRGKGAENVPNGSTSASRRRSGSNSLKMRASGLFQRQGAQMRRRERWNRPGHKLVLGVRVEEQRFETGVHCGTAATADRAGGA